MFVRSHAQWRVWKILPLVVMLIGGTLLGTGSSRAAQPTHHADIVIQFGDGRVDTRRVAFDTLTISGSEALRLAGFDLEQANGAVCRVDRTGCPSSDCFCAYPPLFWNYSHFIDGVWQFAETGAEQYQVTDGAVEGWSWGRALPTVAPPALGAKAGVAWLHTQQAADGSYGAKPGITLDTLLAAASTGEDPTSWQQTGGRTLIDYLSQTGSSYAASGVREAGKLALSLAAADLDPRAFIHQDLVISLTNRYNAGTGAFGTSNWDQSFAMLGWRASGETVPVSATQALARRVNADGGWGFNPGDASDVDTTALALQALVAGGESVTATVVLSGTTFLQAAQNTDGGFPVVPATDNSDQSNANSTAFAVQGLLAGGLDPSRIAPTIGGTTPISYLLALQLSNGGISYLAPPSEASLLATQQAIPALAGRPFPYLSRAVALRRALAWIATQQQPDGSFAGFGTGATIDAVLAIAAVGGDPRSFKSAAGKTALDYLQTQAASYGNAGASAAGKLIAGIVALHADPRTIGGTNLVISTTATYNAATGAFGSSTFDQSWAIIGLRAAGVTVPLSATQSLQQRAASTGGWGFGEGDAPDTNSTGLALQALAAAGIGRESAAVRAGLDYLRGVQNADGGFAYTNDGSPTDANSTGLVLGGLAAYGENARGLDWTTTMTGTSGITNSLTLHTPVDTLLTLQSPSGAFVGFSGPDDPSATYQALPGLAARAVPTAVRRIVYLPSVLK